MTAGENGGPRDIQELVSLEQVSDLSVSPDRLFNSADHREIAAGHTTDIYFIKTRQILDHLGLADVPVVAEVFTSGPGVFCGIDEVKNLLEGRVSELYGLPEGAEFERKEVVLRIHGSYADFAMTETLILGMLASASAWATRGREVREAAGDKTVICFGARHVHPAVAPVMERAAVIGGMDGCSCILGARLLGRIPTGTVPHAPIIIAGDTLKVAEAYDEIMPAGDPRIILVDTFKDEVEESLRVARSLGQRLGAVRLDTPAERGRVTAELVHETRVKLDLAGFSDVRIFCSGGLDPERIRELGDAGADGFGVGSYVAGTGPINMTMDLKEVWGEGVAKRGRLPGRTSTPRLERLI